MEGKKDTENDVSTYIGLYPLVQLMATATKVSASAVNEDLLWITALLSFFSPSTLTGEKTEGNSSMPKVNSRQSKDTQNR